MKSIIFGLSFAGAAVAQIVNGVSMVSMPSYDSASASSSSGGYYGGYAPAETTAASSTSNAYDSQYTQPPDTSSYDIYSVMPYSSMTAGGYQSLDCGYGYSKNSNGYCQAESWVCSDYLIFLFIAMFTDDDIIMVISNLVFIRGML